MKKLILLTALAAALFTSCTEKSQTRRFGGEFTVELKPGQKFVNATWKEDNLWYLTTPMDSTHVPTTYTFTEDSEHGVWEGTVTFKETK